MAAREQLYTDLSHGESPVWWEKSRACYPTEDDMSASKQVKYVFIMLGSRATIRILMTAAPHSGDWIAM